jgi:hypothetical protein
VGGRVPRDMTRKTDNGLLALLRRRRVGRPHSFRRRRPGADPGRDRARKHVPRSVYGMSHQVSFYRPRIECLFAHRALDGGAHRNRPLPQEHAPIHAVPVGTCRAALSVSGEVTTPCLGRRRAKRISAESECEAVFFMTAARWFSTVRWLIPRAAAMFLLGGRRAPGP